MVVAAGQELSPLPEPGAPGALPEPELPEPVGIDEGTSTAVGIVGIGPVGSGKPVGAAPPPMV